jgi:hypothetical protein
VNTFHSQAWHCHQDRSGEEIGRTEDGKGKELGEENKLVDLFSPFNFLDPIK